MDQHQHQEQASDGQRQLPSLLSHVPARIDWQAELSKTEVALRTVEVRQAMAELAACLTLVAPVGMSADDRAEWLKVAAMTIGDVPQGALQKACAEARVKVRRVSELVPMIIEQVGTEHGRLCRHLENIKWRIAHPLPERLEGPTDDRPLTADELLKMTPQLRRIARRNGLASEEVFREVDRVLDERQAAAGGD